MDQTIELVPLVCLRCNTAIPAGPEEVAWACAQCGQGMALDETRGLEPLELHYAVQIPENALGKPFWVADGQVSMKRQSYGSSGKQVKEAEEFWSRPRRFFVPAFQAPLERLLEAAKGMLLTPPNLAEGATARFEPVTLYREDVLSAAEFIVMAIEAERKDQIKSIDFELRLSPPVLWILP